MDYTIDHALNHAIREHPLLVAIISGFANWGVVAFGVAACALWLFDKPREPGVWRRATAAGLSAAAVGLLANQLVAQLWHRPRPYQDHPLGILPLLTPSHDPSFPSDHATAAFAIAVAVLLRDRRWGAPVLAAAVVLAAGRVALGVHYPTDVVGGALLGTASALALWTPPARRALHAAADLAGRALDAMLSPLTAR
jgi:undecaprenyl-diphosphatase